MAHSYLFSSFQQYMGQYRTENRTGLYGRRLDRTRYNRPGASRQNIPAGSYRAGDSYQATGSDNTDYRGEEQLNSRIEWEQR